ncbi:recombinase family protein [Legionella massiliensis]
MLDLQIDALMAEGIEENHIYQDHASGKQDGRPGLDACLKALRTPE